MYKNTIVGGMILLSLLAACSETTTPPAKLPPAPVLAAAPVAPPAKPVTAPTTVEKIDAILMKAVFDEQYRPATGDALAELPDVDPANREVMGSYLVEPQATTVLKTGETILVANAQITNEKGEAMSGHATPGLLNVYVLRQTDGKWQVLKRHENVASLGSNGHFGQVSWPMVGKDRPGMAILHGGTWQGSSMQSVSLFDLTNGELRELNPQSIDTHSNDDCHDERAGDCFSVTGKWRFVPPKVASDYDDFLVVFSGEESGRPGDDDDKPTGPRVVTKKISGTARYAFDGKQYKLVEGENLVPGI